MHPGLFCSKPTTKRTHRNHTVKVPHLCFPIVSSNGQSVARFWSKVSEIYTSQTLDSAMVDNRRELVAKCVFPGEEHVIFLSFSLACNFLDPISQQSYEPISSSCLWPWANSYNYQNLWWSATILNGCFVWCQNQWICISRAHFILSCKIWRMGHKLSGKNAKMTMSKLNRREYGHQSDVNRMWSGQNMPKPDFCTSCNSFNFQFPFNTRCIWGRPLQRAWYLRHDMPGTCNMMR